MHLRVGPAGRLPQDDGAAPAWATSSTATSCCSKFVDIQYDRNDIAFERGRFRVRGDVVELWPAYDEIAYRIELFGDEVERLATIDPLTGNVIETHQDMYVYPAATSSCPRSRSRGAVEKHQRGAGAGRLQQPQGAGQVARSPAAVARTRYDMEMLLEVGYCSGIENYLRHLSGREAGRTTPQHAARLLPPDSLILIDESHVSIPQIPRDVRRRFQPQEHAGRARVPPPAAKLDNRPLRFDEWEKKFGARRLYVSATPGDYEAAMSAGRGGRAGDPADRAGRPGSSGSSWARGQVPALLGEIGAAAQGPSGC